MKTLYLFMVVMGVMVTSIVSDARADTVPYQLALIHPLQTSNSIHSVKGWRLNIFYGVNQNVSGLDVGLVNQVEGDQKGVQIGLFNTSFKSSGIQIGLFNRTEYLNGLQIGILNMHGMGDQFFRILPGINFSF